MRVKYQDGAYYSEGEETVRRISARSFCISRTNSSSSMTLLRRVASVSTPMERSRSKSLSSNSEVRIGAQPSIQTACCQIIASRMMPAFWKLHSTAVWCDAHKAGNVSALIPRPPVEWGSLRGLKGRAGYEQDSIRPAPEPLLNRLDF